MVVGKTAYRQRPISKRKKFVLMLAQGRFLLRQNDQLESLPIPMILMSENQTTAVVEDYYRKINSWDIFKVMAIPAWQFFQGIFG